MSDPEHSVPNAAPNAAPNAVSVVRCEDLDAAIEAYQATGFRLDALGPADEPTWAEVSSPDRTVVLDTEPAGSVPGERRGAGSMRVPGSVPELAVTHEQGSGWVTGRADMRYRDLVPNRWGGAYIASHIHVPVGGPVPDYVHHHDIAYQLIFCHRGWVRVVYQDQGPPFVMGPGDGVLQPPGIRHQVLESSDDLYVVEITCPAVHRTSLDHDLSLPTDEIMAEARYGGQRFVRHVGQESRWQASATTGFDEQVTAIAEATNDLVDVRVIAATTASLRIPLDHNHDFLLVFLLRGSASFRRSDGTAVELNEGSSLALPSNSGPGCELIDVTDDTQILQVASTVAAT